MDAHRIEVLHVADGDAVVATVANDLVLDLLPAAQAFLHQHLASAAGECALDRGRRAPTSVSTMPLPLPPKRIAAAQHDRQADDSRGLDARPRGEWQARLRAVLTPISARRCTKRARSSVSRMVEIGVPRTRTPCRASTPASSSARPQFSAVCPPKESSSASTSSLTMMRSTNSGIDSDEVDAVGEVLAGLDRGDVRIDEDGGDALFAQRLERLRTRVVELAGLADLQRARAEHQYTARLAGQVLAVHAARPSELSWRRQCAGSHRIDRRCPSGPGRLQDGTAR